jgi:hypothetical protein
MNVAQLLRLEGIYRTATTGKSRAVIEATTAVIRLECRARAVEIALEALGALYEAVDKGQAGPVEILSCESFVATCWALHMPRGEVTHKG